MGYLLLVVSYLICDKATVKLIILEYFIVKYNTIYYYRYLHTYYINMMKMVECYSIPDILCTIGYLIISYYITEERDYHFRVIFLEHKLISIFL